MELDDEWETLMNKLGFHQQGQTRRVMSVADDLTVTSVDFGRLDGMDVWSMQARNLAQMLEQAVNGDDEAVIETAKGAFMTLVDSFTGGSPLGSGVVKAARGQETTPFLQQQFPEWYDNIVAGIGETFGSETGIAVANRVSNIFDFFTPGSLKQGLRGKAAEQAGREPLVAWAIGLGMPVANDNPLRALRGARAAEYLRTRNGSSAALEGVVSLATDRNLESLVDNAVTTYIDTQRDAYTELSEYVQVARAAGDLAGKSQREVEELILTALRSNNGFSREDASRLAQGLPFVPRPPSNEKQFLKGPIERRLRSLPEDTPANEERKERMAALMEQRRLEIIAEINDRIKNYNQQ
jgi:hypothetical protein